MSGEHSPTKQNLRRMNISRAAQKKSPKLRRMKRGRKTNKTLIKYLQDCAAEFTESSMSDTDSTNSFVD
nr:ORF3 [Torque teno felis virus]